MRLEERLILLREIGIKMKKRIKDYIESFARDIGVSVKVGKMEVMLAVDYLTTMEEEVPYVFGKKPYGVCAAILPYDASCIMFARIVGSAFLAGNKVLISFSSLTPGARDVTNEIVKEVTDAVNINVSYDNRRFGDLVTFDHSVRIFYISGGDDVGRLFESRKSFFDKIVFAGPSGMPICVVNTGSNLKEIAEFVCYRAFLNGGQYCTTIKRVLVREDIYDDFLEYLLTEAKKIKVGDPFDPETDYGPIKAERTIRLFERILNSMKGRILTGGKIEDGGYIMPTIAEIDDIPDLESFGPFLGVIKYRTVEEAVSYSLNTRFRHIIYMFGDFPNDLLRVVKDSYGMVYHNEFVRYLPVRMPYGGRMDAGWVLERKNGNYVKRDGPIVYSSEFCY